MTLRQPTQVWKVKRGPGGAWPKARQPIQPSSGQNDATTGWRNCQAWWGAWLEMSLPPPPLFWFERRFSLPPERWAALTRLLRHCTRITNRRLLLPACRDSDCSSRLEFRLVWRVTWHVYFSKATGSRDKVRKSTAAPAVGAPFPPPSPHPSSPPPAAAEPELNDTVLWKVCIVHWLMFFLLLSLPSCVCCSRERERERHTSSACPPQSFAPCIYF